jgi:dihydrofolate synthase / folylpolyglutamate synthase
VYTAAHHKGAAARHIADKARHAHATAVIHLAETIADAVRLSTLLAQTLGRKIYMAGGLFVAVEYATVVRGGRAEDLRFF